MKKTLSIRTYLGLSYALLLISSLSLVGLLWSRNEYHIFTQEFQSLVHERVEMIASILSHEYAEFGYMEMTDFDVLSVSPEQQFLLVYFDQSGAMTKLSTADLDPEEEELMRRLYGEYHQIDRSFSKIIDKESNTTHVYAAAPVLDPEQMVIGTVCIIVSLKQFDLFILQQRDMLIGAIILVALIAIGVSVLLTNYFSRQFSLAQNLAGMVAKGNYHIRIPETGPRELSDLARYLNSMAANLQDQAQIRRRLLANVAHELARPLAGIQVGVDSLRKGAIKDPDLADDLLVSMSRTVANLDGLIDDIALAAQPSARPIELHRTAVAVEPFVQGIAARYGILTDSRGIHLDVKVDEDLPALDVDEKRLNQIVGNLMDNAIKFSQQGTTIHLTAERKDAGFIKLEIQDEGPGISSADIEHVFEAFYQGNRGRKIKQGMGLGLSIANQLVLAHGGQIILENHSQGGLKAVLVLPVWNA